MFSSEPDPFKMAGSVFIFIAVSGLFYEGQIRIQGQLHPDLELRILTYWADRLDLVVNRFTVSQQVMLAIKSRILNMYIYTFYVTDYYTNLEGNMECHSGDRMETSQDVARGAEGRSDGRGR